MVSRIYGLSSALLIAFVVLVPGQYARADENLPIYTSPIDITPGRIQLLAVLPNRDTGAPQTQPFPLNQLPPRFRTLLATPLAAQLDQYWNSGIDPESQLTLRQAACDGPHGMKQRLREQLAGMAEFSPHSISCELATQGIVVAKKSGRDVFISYQLLNNSVEFYVATPFPLVNDPKIRVTFAIELVTLLRAPSLCELRTDGSEMNLHAVQIDGANAPAKIVQFVAAQGKFTAAELALQSLQREIASPLEGPLAALRNGPECSGRQFAAFSELETEVKLFDGVILRAIHPPIEIPRFQNTPQPNGPDTAAFEPPTFVRPTLVVPPIVPAGAGVTLYGQFFPATPDPSLLILYLERHGNTACNGGATELEWGENARPPFNEKLPAIGNWSQCGSRRTLTGLLPDTLYRFRARDCGTFTCSLWTEPLMIRTGRITAPPQLQLTLDNAIPLGTTQTGSLSSFQTPIRIPPDAAEGKHTIRAASSKASAEVSFQVTRSARPQLVLTSRDFGDIGCPMRPLPDYAQKVATNRPSFGLYGTGLRPGSVLIRLDSPSGHIFGSATVDGYGSFCSELPAPPDTLLGKHTLVAIQDGVVQASILVEVFTLFGPN